MMRNELHFRRRCLGFTPQLAATVLTGFSLLLSGVSASGALSTDLEGYWPMEGNGVDLSGNSRDLTINGSPAFGTGLKGQALVLTGNPSQFADRGVDDAVYDPGSSDFSLQIWVNFSSTGGEQTLIEKFTGGSGPGFSLTKLSSGQIQMYATNFALTSAPQSFSAGTWYHFVFTRDGNTITLYLNNMQVGQTTTTASVPDTSADLMIGEREWTGQTFPVRGAIDEVAFWSRALSVQEVSDLYNNGAGGDFFPVVLDFGSDLEGYWPLDGDGADRSGNNRSLTLNGAPSFAAGLKDQALELVGNAAQFADRGMSDAVFDPGGSSFAFQIWVNFSNPAGEQTLFEKFTGGAGPGYSLSKLTSGQVQFYATTLGVVSAPQSFAAGTWYHFLVTRNGTVSTLYLNGTPIGETITAVAIPATGQDLMIGERDGAQSFPVRGRVDEAAFWSRGLSASEAAGLYNGGSGAEILPVPPVVGQWIQSGTDIEGEALGDQFGRSISISSDGTRVAIGALENDGNGTNAGHVRVYDNINSNWVQVGGDLDGEAALDKSGYSVSISGDGARVAVGARDNDGSLSDAGHVRVYEYSTNSWVQVGNDIDGEHFSDQSGHSVSMSHDGSRVAIGAPANGVDSFGSLKGHVRVYELVGNSWVQQGSDIDGVSPGSLVGWAVALSSNGTRVVVGAPGHTGVGSFRGQVKIYHDVGGTWNQVGATLSGQEDGDSLGSSVAVSADGGRVAIGAQDSDGTGSVRVYELLTGVWTPMGADIASEELFDSSGQSVALSADGMRVAISASGSNDGGSNTGKVRVFDWTGSSWRQEGNDLHGRTANAHFGFSVALSDDGDTLAVGANGGPNPSMNPSYAAIYHRVSVPVPLLFCPSNVMVECGDSTDPADIGAPAVIDSCDTNLVATFSDTLSLTDCPTVIMRLWTASNSCGGISVCTQTITIVDTTAPELNCPSDLTVSNYFGAEGSIVRFTNTVSDACDPAPSLMSSRTSGEFFFFGTTTVFVAAADACGNSNACQFTITLIEQPFVDTDNDGIDDNWETLVFTNLMVAGTNTDFDLDHQLDRDEYLSGTDATDMADFLGIKNAVIDSGGRSLTWSIEPGKAYRVQHRDDLLSSAWSNIANGVSSGTYLDDSPDRLDLPQGYYRVVLP